MIASGEVITIYFIGTCMHIQVIITLIAYSFFVRFRKKFAHALDFLA